MFCPKCGTDNPDTGKFCRSCGIDLENVSAVLSGKPPANLIETPGRKARRREDPAEVFGDAVRNGLMGVGFIIISLVLFFTNAAGGQTWWWAMLFPGLILLAMGSADVIRYGLMKGQHHELSALKQHALGRSAASPSLRPSAADYAISEMRHKTADLAPPSVTESTTRLLELESEKDQK